MADDNEIDLTNLMYKNDDSKSKDIKKPEKTEQGIPDLELRKIEKIIDKNTKKEKKKEIPQKTTASALKDNGQRDEDIINKRRLILLLQFYLNEFPDKLKTFKKINLEKKDIEELKDLQKEFDFVIGNQSNIKGGTEMVLSGIQALEYIAVSFTPLQCNGLSENIKNDPESIDTIKHLCLKHMGNSMFNTEPEHRLLYKLMTTALSLHTVNSFSQNMITHNDSIIQKVNLEFIDI